MSHENMKKIKELKGNTFRNNISPRPSQTFDVLQFTPKNNESFLTQTNVPKTIFNQKSFTCRKIKHIV